MLEAILAIILASLGALAVGWREGRKRERERREAEDARAYQQTMERMHDADTGRGDPADDTEWLRNRASGR